MAALSCYQPCRSHLAQPARCFDDDDSRQASATLSLRRRQFIERCHEARNVRHSDLIPEVSVKKTREELTKHAAQTLPLNRRLNVESGWSKVEEVRKKFEDAAAASSFSRSFESPPRRRLADSLFASFKLPRKKDGMSAPRSLAPQPQQKRKSAVELLAESKAFYVKSETVLDRKQELPLRVSSGLSQAIAAGGCHLVSSGALNNDACCNPYGTTRSVGSTRRAVSAGEGLQNTLRRLLEHSDSRENVYSPAYASHKIYAESRRLKDSYPDREANSRSQLTSGTFSGTSSSGTSGSKAQKSDPDKMNRPLSFGDARVFFPESFVIPRQRPNEVVIKNAYSIPSSHSSPSHMELPEPVVSGPGSPEEQLGAISPPAQYAHSAPRYIRSNSHSQPSGRGEEGSHINSHKSLPDLHTQARCYTEHPNVGATDTIGSVGRSPRRRRHSNHQRTASCSSKGTRSNHSSLMSSCEAFSEHPSPGEDNYQSYNSRCGSSFARDSGGSSGHYTQRSAPPHHHRRTDSGSSTQHDQTSRYNSYYPEYGHGELECYVSAPPQFQDGAPSPPPAHAPPPHYPPHPPHPRVGIHFQVGLQFQDGAPSPPPLYPPHPRVGIHFQVGLQFQDGAPSPPPAHAPPPHYPPHPPHPRVGIHFQVGLQFQDGAPSPPPLYPPHPRVGIHFQVGLQFQDGAPSPPPAHAPPPHYPPHPPHPRVGIHFQVGLQFQDGAPSPPPLYPPHPRVGIHFQVGLQFQDGAPSPPPLYPPHPRVGIHFQVGLQFQDGAPSPPPAHAPPPHYPPHPPHPRVGIHFQVGLQFQDGAPSPPPLYPPHPRVGIHFQVGLQFQDGAPSPPPAHAPPPHYPPHPPHPRVGIHFQVGLQFQDGAPSPPPLYPPHPRVGIHFQVGLQFQDGAPSPPPAHAPPPHYPPHPPHPRVGIHFQVGLQFQDGAPSPPPLYPPHPRVGIHFQVGLQFQDGAPSPPPLYPPHPRVGIHFQVGLQFQDGAPSPPPAHAPPPHYPPHPPHPRVGIHFQVGLQFQDGAPSPPPAHAPPPHYPPHPPHPRVGIHFQVGLQFQDGAPSPPPAHAPPPHYPPHPPHPRVGIHFQVGLQFQDGAPSPPPLYPPHPRVGIHFQVGLQFQDGAPSPPPAHAPPPHYPPHPPHPRVGIHFQVGLQFQDGAPSPPPLYPPHPRVGIHFQASAPPPQFQDEPPVYDYGDYDCAYKTPLKCLNVGRKEYSNTRDYNRYHSPSTELVNKQPQYQQVRRPRLDDTQEYVNANQMCQPEEITSPLGTFKRQRCLRYKQRRPRPILRSKSDISDRYRRTDGRSPGSAPCEGETSPTSPSEESVRLQQFFERLGLEPRQYDSIVRDAPPESPVFFSSASTVDSNQLAATADYTVQGPGVQKPIYRNTEPPSVVERNARIIKWLCQCRKTQLQQPQ